MAELIDREALIAEIRKQGVLGSGYSDGERENDVVDMIESQYPVEAVPVDNMKEAIKKALLVNCDETKHRYELGKACLDTFLNDCVKYCPNCGALMDGKKDNKEDTV